MCLGAHPLHKLGQQSCSVDKTPELKVEIFCVYFRYKYDWKIEEAKKNLLRTHTTAVSARMLYKLAQQVRGNSCKMYMYCKL
jgi:phenylalanyl-tRNA synthetase alpha subunit